MAITFISRFFATLQAWLHPQPAPTGTGARPATPPATPANRARVVRVVRVAESTAGAGRMVITGRLADVCAELDRLAALEAAAG
jgi:hypothetical protein